MRQSDDANHPHAQFRTSRIFRTDRGWFVDTREGARGPFPSKRLATCDVKNYVRRTTMRIRANIRVIARVNDEI